MAYDPKLISRMYAEGISNRQRRQSEQEAALETERADSARNWMDDGVRGASIGTMFAPGVGTAVGGGIGAGLGMIGAYKDRKDSGMGTLESIGRTIFDIGKLGHSDTIDAGMSAAKMLALKAAMSGASGAFGGENADTISSNIGDAAPTAAMGEGGMTDVYGGARNLPYQQTQDGEMFNPYIPKRNARMQY